MRFFAIFVLVSLLLPGCASKYGQQHTDVHYYPACYRPIHDLRASEHNVTKSTAGGAVVGALGGALLGFLATGKVEGALVGGAAGAATGAVIGNIYGKKQQIHDENRRMASYLEDLDGDIRKLDIVSASAKTSLDCYDREFQILLNDIRTRRIRRREAEDRFGEIASGRDEALALLGNAVTYGQDLDREYEQAFLQEEQRSSKKAKQQLRRARTKKQNYTRRVQEVAQQKNSARARYQEEDRKFNEMLKDIEA